MVDLLGGGRDARVINLLDWRAKMDERERLKHEIARTIRRLREGPHRGDELQELPEEVWQHLYRIVRYGMLAAAFAGAFAAALVLCLTRVLH